MGPKSASMPLAWQMSQRNKRLAMAASVLVHVALHLAIASVVAVFVAEATEHLHGGVALFGGRILVVDQDLVDERLEESQDWSGVIPCAGIGVGLGMLEDQTDRVA